MGKSADVIKKIGLTGVGPVVVLDDVKDAVPLANAMAAGGIPCAEVTLRTAAGMDSIAKIASDAKDVLVGAGSVMNLDQCKDAISNGAQFIVSPGFNQKVVEYCVQNDVAVLPGCVTPTEIIAAMELGLDTVKFFPANVYGGLPAMKALNGPFPKIKFLPTGGVNAANLADYISAPFVHAVGGSWVCAKADVAAGNFDKITALCREARKIVLGFELAHLGINTENADAALEVSKALSAAFGLPIKEGNSSNFVADEFEVMKHMGHGTNGHIAIRTNSIPRALEELKTKGFEADEATAVYKGGKLHAIYLKNEVGGFAIHLLQK